MLHCYLHVLNIYCVVSADCSFSFLVASEALLTLESLSSLPQKVMRKLGSNRKGLKLGFEESVLMYSRRRLAVSAEKLLKQDWDARNVENGWKSKVRQSTL